MLSRSTLSTCRISLGRTVTPRVFFYSTEVRSDATPAKPSKPRRIIPRTTEFDDLIIPKLPSHTLGKNGRSNYTPGLRALGDDEFDGMGRFSQLLARRQTQGRNQQAEAPQGKQVKPAVEIVDVKKPRQQQSHRANTGGRDGQRQGSRDGQRQGSRDGQRQNGRVQSSQGQSRADKPRTGQHQERQPRNAERQTKPRQPKHQSEIKAKETTPQDIIPDNMTTTIEETDLEALFAAPTSPANRVVPLLPSSTNISSLHTQLLLERAAGDYTRYFPENLASAENRTLKALGPTGYAQLTLARRPDAGLKQRQGVVNLVHEMAGAVRPVTDNTHFTA